MPHEFVNDATTDLSRKDPRAVENSFLIASFYLVDRGLIVSFYLVDGGLFDLKQIPLKASYVHD